MTMFAIKMSFMSRRACSRGRARAMNFEHILLVLRARWRLVLAVFGATVIAALLFSLLWPKQYTAISSVVVDAKPDPVSGIPGMAEMALQAYVTTQADVISSQRVAQSVVKALKLESDP